MKSCAGLNPTEILVATNLVKRVRDSGVSLIIIEHMMKAIMGISNRVVVLQCGRKICRGSSL